MNTPAPPKDHPEATPPEPPAHGVPEGASDHEPKGYPTSDRSQTETAVDKA